MANIDSGAVTSMDEFSDLCGRPAKYKEAGPNKNEFLYCEEHANYYRYNKESPWNKLVARNLVLIDA